MYVKKDVIDGIVFLKDNDSGFKVGINFNDYIDFRKYSKSIRTPHYNLEHLKCNIYKAIIGN